MNHHTMPITQKETPNALPYAICHIINLINNHTHTQHTHTHTQTLQHNLITKKWEEKAKKKGQKKKKGPPKTTRRETFFVCPPVTRYSSAGTLPQDQPIQIDSETLGT